MSGGLGLGVRNANLYANETLTSFFRRLTFAPDGSLLFTPAGQYKTATTSGSAPAHKDEDILNTVYIYTRAGLNKPPVAHLPGHKKASIAVKCSPVYYALRVVQSETKEITIDTKAEGDKTTNIVRCNGPSATHKRSFAFTECGYYGIASGFRGRA
jgi:chromatin assembly factor 1 subunit B